MKKEDVLTRVIKYYFVIGTQMKIKGESYLVVSRKLNKKKHYSDPYEYTYELRKVNV